MNNNKGFTLIEMLITMGLVILVIMISSSAFNTILKSSSSIISSEESNIEGVVGLEMFRHDLQQAGFGLPDSFDKPGIVYSEAKVAPASLLNDASTLPAPVPRAIVSIDSINSASDSNSESGVSYNILSGTDYVAIKATTVGRTKASKKWTYLTYSAGVGRNFTDKAPNKWPNPEDNITYKEKAIVIKRVYSAAFNPTSMLVYNNNNTGDTSIYWPSNPTVNMNDDFNPKISDTSFYLYGVDDGSLGMPFNRADYFVARPSASNKVPASCAPNTGILYKATVNHADGKLFYMPLLDCVADMQVAFGWYYEGSSSPDKITFSDANGYGSETPLTVSWLLSPSEIKSRLKLIKVYIMAQDGRKDSNYQNTNTLGPSNNTYAVVVGEPGPSPASNISITKAYTAAELATKGWQNYRWKTYRIIVKPINLTN